MSDAGFQALGLSAEEEALYRILLKHPGEPLTSLSRTLGTTQGALRETTKALEARGLLSRSAGRAGKLMAAPPELALQLLIHQRQQELDRTQLAAHQLIEELKVSAVSTAPAEVVEVLRGRDAVGQRFIQLERAVIGEILAFDKPPYADFSGQNEDEVTALDRGVVVRVVYDRESLEYPGQMEYLTDIVKAGEQARVLADVPMKLDIFDRRVALVPLNTGEPGIEGALMIHESPLLLALVRLWEAMWELAIPVPITAVTPDDVKATDEDGRPPEETLELLTLLASGLKDESIARQLGISLRTVKRRVRELLDQLGADTRFQAGLQASRRGWL